MQSKIFLLILAIILTIVNLLGYYTINQGFNDASQSRSDRSTMIHNYLFDNITSLKKTLDPILATVPNATQAEIERDLHYNQTTEDFKKIEQVLEIKLQDHVTLGVLNQSVFNILEILNHTSSTDNGTIIPVPVPVNPSPPAPLPIPPVINNGSVVPVKNLTGVIT